MEEPESGRTGLGGGADGGRMRNPSPLPPPPPPDPLPLLLIISGSALLPFLGFFIPFPISKKTTVKQTGPPVSPIGPCFKTIEEAKWGKWVHSRWKLERVNTGMIEVLPTHTFKIKRSYWIQLGGGLERLSLGCIWGATRQRGRGNFVTVRTYSNSPSYAHKFEIFQQQV